MRVFYSKKGIGKMNKFSVSMLLLIFAVSCSPSPESTAPDKIDRMPILGRNQPMKKGLVIEFASYEANKFLGSGWGDMESDRRWMIDSPAHIEFPLTDITTLKISIEAKPFTSKQVFIVKVNGTKVRTIRSLDPEKFITSDLNVSVALLKKKNRLTITCDDLRSPAQMGRGSDQRKLGLAVKKISIRGKTTKTR